MRDILICCLTQEVLLILSTLNLEQQIKPSSICNQFTQDSSFGFHEKILSPFTISLPGWVWELSGCSQVVQLHPLGHRHWHCICYSWFSPFQGEDIFTFILACFTVIFSNEDPDLFWSTVVQIWTNNWNNVWERMMPTMNLPMCLGRRWSQENVGESWYLIVQVQQRHV